MLKKFLNIKTITRDFSKTYRNAINEACPNAKHIIDRFHIFKNLTDDMYDYLKRTTKDNIKMINSTSIIDKEQILNKRQKDKLLTSNRKWETILEIKKLKIDGKSIEEIANLVHLHRVTVSKYLKLEESFVRSDNSILDNYITLIKKSILQGFKIDEIYKTLKENGYKGKQSLLYSRLKGIKQELKNNTSYLKRSKLKKMLYIEDVNKIKDEDTRNSIIKYLTINKELNNIINLVRNFKEVIFSRKPEFLDIWLEKAKKLAVPELNRFVKLIQSEIEGVKNAIIYYKYSNGLTEGFNNKTKVIKRQMYGRCSFELLRLKILS